jgi:SAM-dependent methyltransferase
LSNAALIDWRLAGAEPDPCLVCDEVAHRAVYPPTYAGTLDQASAFFLERRTATAHGPIVGCSSCGFVFTSPRFSPADYDAIYGGIPPSAATDGAFEVAKLARFRRLASIVRRFQPEGGTFLDFGCGDGGFLRAYGDRAGRGFEVGSPGRRMAGPYPVITGDWGEVAGSAATPLGSLDFIVAFDVLEHLPRLERDVRLVKTVLKPGGLFFASVPNIESLVARLMGKRWNMLLLEHLWYFSPATFERFMQRLGFELVHLRPVPFDASVGHIATRLAQTFGKTGRVELGLLSRLVLPTPAGIMLGVFRSLPG